MGFLAGALLAVTLSWTDNSNNEDGFIAYRSVPGGSFVELGRVGSGVVTFSDASAVGGACYKVSAYNLAGESGPSNTVCLPLPPAAPTALLVR